MTDEQDCPPALGDVVHLTEALLLEVGIADREHFVDDQDFRLEVRCDRKRQADIHARAVSLHRRVEEFFALAERDDFVEFSRDFRAAHPEDGAVEIDVFASGQFRMKAGAHFEQRSNSAAQNRPALARLGDTRQQLQQRALARAVSADQADDLAFVHFKRRILQSPERVVALGSVAGAGFEMADHVPPHAGDRVAQSGVLVELLAEGSTPFPGLRR